MYVMRQPAIRPWCSGCQSALCVCHESPRMRAERLAREAPIAPAPITENVIAVVPCTTEGVLLEGVATSSGWDAIEVPLAAGLVRLDGSTTTRRRGREPLKMTGSMPLPLLISHDWNRKVGELYAARATTDVVYFKAVVVPPGTPGYDAALLERTWAELRAGELGCVSYASSYVGRDGSWAGSELSLCPQGAHPFAVVTEATFPDGHLIRRAQPVIDIHEVVAACDRHYAAAAARKVQTQEVKKVARAADPPAWNITTTYRRGAKVRHAGRIWNAMRDNSGRKPDGMGDSWRKLPISGEVD